VSASQDILSPLLHVDGSVQIQLESGTWNASSQSCNGDCHIGDEDEEHEDEEWD
jgi:hypothetical protein